MLKTTLMSGFLLFLIVVPALCEFESIRKMILVTMKEKCLNVTDDMDLYADIHTELGDTIHCINELVDVNSMRYDFNRLVGQGALHQLFNKYCKVFDDGLHCLDGLSMSVNHCLHSYEIKQKDHLIRGVEKWKSLICEEEGDMLAEFYSNGKECLEKNQNKLKNCFQTIFPTRGVRDVKLFMPEEEQCETIAATIECVEPILGNCENTAAYDFIMESINIFWEEFACESSAATTRISFMTGVLCAGLWIFISYNFKFW